MEIVSYFKGTDKVQSIHNVSDGLIAVGPQRMWDRDGNLIYEYMYDEKGNRIDLEIEDNGNNLKFNV